MRSVDLNADVGEATDDAGITVERDLLDLVTSVHVACGGHAGDEASMQATVAAALERGVQVGAHPSYPDREGFGRRPLDISASALEASLRNQIRALVEVCRARDTTVHSVKAHGALYGEVAQGGAALDALRAAVSACCQPGTALVLLAGSPAVALCRGDGVTVHEEGFCDRAYAADGTLVGRSEEGAVFSDPGQAARQAVELATNGTVDTLCIHGDSPGAVELATAVRRALQTAGVGVTAAPDR
jgi:5-oxoprolinase (ATP-hydrolysing) subunit A